MNTFTLHITNNEFRCLMRDLELELEPFEEDFIMSLVYDRVREYAELQLRNEALRYHHQVKPVIKKAYSNIQAWPGKIKLYGTYQDD